MKLESAGGRSSVERLRETPRLDLVKNALEGNLEALAKGRELFLYDLESAARPGSGESARKRTLDDIQPNRPISPLGDALHGVLAGHRGQPVAGLVIATDGRSNAGEEPLRAIEAAVRQNIPIYRRSPPERLKGRGMCAWRRSRSARSSSYATRRHWRSWSRHAGCATPRRRSSSNSESMKATGRPSANQRVVLGEDGILKRTTFRITPKVVGQYEFRARVEDAGPELTQEDNVATAAVKVVRQQIRVLLDRRLALAGGPVPAERARCATSASSSPAGCSTPIPGFASRATGRSAVCRTTRPSCATTMRFCSSTRTSGHSGRNGRR